MMTAVLIVRYTVEVCTI